MAVTALRANSIPHEQNHEVARLALLALGVIYGDIGTSPLYALRECFSGSHAVGVSHANVLGVLSLVFWTLLLVITLKYHVYVIRANNRGEGGILALVALVGSVLKSGRIAAIAIGLGLFGAALLYADGALTPAISVLSAVEGLSVATNVFDPYIVPMTVAILIGLFLVQHHGTGGVGSIFGPIMIVWFSTLAILGISGIVREPAVLAAVNPLHAVQFFAHNNIDGFLVLGSVFLVATGGEALYADLGHFGEKPVQIDWFCFVAPALLLNYFGQGALLIANPEAAVNPFYLLAPSWALYPLVGLATAATIIASQAVITGVFSLTMQAVQLGYLPRVKIEHTSERTMGQIYIGSVNWILMILTLGLVLGFGSSSAMAGAYGMAIATTMVITTVLAFPVAWKLWGWPLPLALGVSIAFLTIDLVFFGANLFKILHGGWFPLVTAAAVYVVMRTWKSGRALVAKRLNNRLIPMDIFLQSLARVPPTRIKGIGVYMTASPTGVPLALVHNLKHNQVLHETIVLLTLVTEAVPYVNGDGVERFQQTPLGYGFHRVIARYGFMEERDVLSLLARVSLNNNPINPQVASYFLSRETLIATPQPGMAVWREKLFVGLARNAGSAASFFNLPPNRVVEIGTQIEL
jgi:KUP system potassium uptake protein